MPKRIALIVGTTTYQDKRLGQLAEPDVDLPNLAQIFRDYKYGAFADVDLCFNQTANEVHGQIRSFFGWKKSDDQLLLYLVGHLLVDESGRLYLATTDTRLDALAETAVPAEFLTNCIDCGFSSRQVILLDCDFALVTGQQDGPKPGHEVNIGGIFAGNNNNRAILTATDKLQYVIRPDSFVGKTQDGLLTAALIQGFTTGASDTNQDGLVTVSELYQAVKNYGAQQPGKPQPRMWVCDGLDQFLIGRNPTPLEFKSPVKWDLVMGAVLAPTMTIVIGATASLSMSVGMAGLLMLLYAGLYWVLD